MSTISGAIHQRGFLVRQAVFLAEQVPKLVSDIEYMLIARALSNAGDQGESLRYWSKAIAASRTENSKALSVRSFAGFCFVHGNFEEGRRHYEESLKLLDGQTDSVRHARGETYLRWGSNEKDAGFLHEAERLFERARIAFEGIGAPGMKRHGLQSLDDARGEMSDATVSTPSAGGKPT